MFYEVEVTCVGSLLNIDKSCIRKCWKLKQNLPFMLLLSKDFVRNIISYR